MKFYLWTFGDSCAKMIKILLDSDRAGDTNDI